MQKYLLLILLTLFFGCKKEHVEEERKKSNVLPYEEYSAHDWYKAYSHNQIDSAVLLLEKRLDSLPTELPTLACYGEVLFRKRLYDRALMIADSVLSLDSAFGHAYKLKGDIYFRKRIRDTTISPQTYFDLYEKATKVAPRYGKGWEALYCVAEELENDSLQSLALRKIAKTGFYTTSTLQMARTMLHSLPDSAIFVTTGDLEYFPAKMLQEVEKTRRDVTILNYSLLNGRYHFNYAQKQGLLLSITDSAFAQFRNFKVGRTYKGRGFALLNALLVDFDNGAVKRPICVASLPTTNFMKPVSSRMKHMGLTKEILPLGSEKVLNADTLAAFFRRYKASDYVEPAVSKYETSPVMLSTRYERKQDFNMIIPGLVAIGLYIEEKKFSQANAMAADVRNFLIAIKSNNTRCFSILESYQQQIAKEQKKVK